MCPKCGKDNGKNDTHGGSYCHECKNEYQKQQGYNRVCYLKNKDSIIARLKLRKQARVEIVRDAKNKPCMDCGISYPYWIMQFDHVRGIKTGNLGQMLWRFGIKRILEEISKCEVVCANCHANRTYIRQKNNGEVV
jgi:hypothetical protein